MMILAHVDNEREELRRLRNLSEGVLRDKVYKAIESGAEKVAAEARLRAPKLTGALEASIKTRGSKRALNATVYADYPKTHKRRKKKTRKQAAGSRVYYALAMEYGTRHVSARPFLVPALEAKSKEIFEEIQEPLNDAGETV